MCVSGRKQCLFAFKSMEIRRISPVLILEVAYFFVLSVVVTARRMQQQPDDDGKFLLRLDYVVVVRQHHTTSCVHCEKAAGLRRLSCFQFTFIMITDSKDIAYTTV